MATLTFERHLRREIVSASLIVLAAFAGLFAFFDLIHEIEDLGKGSYGFGHALAVVLLWLPGRVYEVLPIAVLIGSLYALTVLARHSEITVLRASGLSTARLSAALLKTGLIFSLLTLLVGEFVAPPAERAAQRLRLSAQSQLIGQEFRSGLWVKDGASFINAREVTPDARLREVYIYRFDEAFRLASAKKAQEARYLPSGRWALEEVAETRFAGDRITVEKRAYEEWETALDPDILAVLMVVPERMTLLHLSQYIHHLAENRQQTQRYEIAFWKKIVYPATVLVMLLLALPFAYLHDRFGAVSGKVFAGVMLGVAFHAANGLFSHLGLLRAWPPAWAALAPAALFLVLAVSFLWWVERR